jgi:hypothetical protein
MALFTPKPTVENNETAGAVFHFPASKKALIIFTRNPELGKVKTRLAASIGDEKALNIYTFLLKHTIKITQHIAADKYVYYSENIALQDLWDNDIYRKKLQKGTDLGQRMYHAFKELFSLGYQKVIIVGSDIYDLKQQDIDEAFNKLDSHPYVIGPALDGGYYLLGMTQLYDPIFKNKQWGTNTVLQNTLQDLKNKRVLTLAPKNDVDYLEDIKDVPIFKQFLS